MNPTLRNILSSGINNYMPPIRQSAMISRTGTGVKNGITLPNPISFKDSGARVEMQGQTLTNLVTNGNFTDDSSWTPSAGTESIASNTYSLIGDGSSAVPYFSQIIPITIIGHLYYIKIKNKVNNSLCTYTRMNFAGYQFNLMSAPTIDTWYSYITVRTASNANANLIIYQYYADAATANGKILQVQEVEIIDLTAHYGAGNEPTAGEMDLIAPTWFDGTVNVVNPALRSVGKNLFDKDSGDIAAGYINASGSVTAGSTNRVTGHIYIFPSLPYTISGRTFSQSAGVCLAFYDSSQTFISSASMSGSGNITVTAPSNARYIRFSFNITEIYTIQLELGSVATTYEAYKSNELALTGTLRSVVDTGVLYRDRLYNSNGIWYIDRYVDESTGLKQTMATETATVSGVPYVYRNGTSIIETSVIAPLVDTEIPYSAMY